MQYSQFEKILADVFSVNEKNLGAFRARLRHLRNLDMPRVPKRGSGNTVIYKPIDVISAFVALELQALGSSPAISVDLARFAGEHFEKTKSGGGDVCLVIANTPSYSDVSGSSNLAPAKEGDPLFPGAPATVKAARAVTNPLGGRTIAFVVVGSLAEVVSFLEGTRALGISMINMSERFRALPRET
jgi:hypothetical protein